MIARRIVVAMGIVAVTALPGVALARAASAPSPDGTPPPAGATHDQMETWMETQMGTTHDEMYQQMGSWMNSAGGCGGVDSGTGT